MCRALISIVWHSFAGSWLDRLNENLLRIYCNLQQTHATRRIQINFTYKTITMQWSTAMQWLYDVEIPLPLNSKNEWKDKQKHKSNWTKWLLNWHNQRTAIECEFCFRWTQEWFKWHNSIKVVSCEWIEDKNNETKHQITCKRKRNEIIFIYSGFDEWWAMRF